MKDTVIKGSGNSRSMKTVPNAPIIYPDFATFIQAFASTGIPFDMGALDPNGVLEKGTDLTKANLLSDETAALYGDELPENPTPDEVLALLWDKIYRLSTGKVKLSVAVALPDGTPVPDVALSGITSVSGEQIFTDQNGRAVGYANAGSTTVTILDHLDITSTNKTITTTQGGAYTITLTPEKRNFLSLGSSKSLYISGLAKRVDVSVGAGGGGGGSASAGGGGGGYTKTQENVLFERREMYSAQVGSPGSGAIYNAGTGTTSSATRGGNSSFLGVSANGGNPGSNNFGSGGTGNGNGGDGGKNNDNYTGRPGTNGNSTVFSSFENTKAWGGGGGGGSRAANSRGYGGSPGGGAGGDYNVASSSGHDGGGGGGGGRDGSGGSNGANGSSGIVTARIWFEEDLTE